MESVFVSSIQRGLEDVRASARSAIESMGMRPLMAEVVGASSASPQRALLDLVAEADVFLLILGPRYSKPTEDEFDEARRRSIEILVLHQDEVGFDADQERFVERVAGGWKGGRMWGSFVNASDVTLAVVRALSNRANRAHVSTLRPQAEEQARQLAQGTSSWYQHGGSVMRSAHVPLIAGVLLDALRLEAPDLGDRIASIARDHQLMPQSVGINPRVNHEGIALHQVGGSSHLPPLVEVKANASVVCTMEVGGTDQFASMRIDPDRLDDAVRRTGSFCSSVWDLIDDREEVQHVAVAIAIPNAQGKVYGVSTGGSSISSGSFGMPQTVLVPEPPAVVRRAEIGTEELARRLVAEVRRVFTDAGAVQQ